MVEEKTVIKYILREVLPEEVTKKEVIHTKCKNCKCWRPPDQYLSVTGRKLKCCFKCREKCRKARERRKAKKEAEKINYDSDEAERKFMIKLAQRRLNNLYRKA